MCGILKAMMQTIGIKRECPFCKTNHAHTLNHQIAGDVKDAVDCERCSASFVQIKDKWWQVPRDCGTVQDLTKCRECLQVQATHCGNCATQFSAEMDRETINALQEQLDVANKNLQQLDVINRMNIRDLELTSKRLDSANTELENLRRELNLLTNPLQASPIGANLHISISDGMFRVSINDFRLLVNELHFLRKQRDELQSRMTEMALERQSSISIVTPSGSTSSSDNVNTKSERSCAATT